MKQRRGPFGNLPGGSDLSEAALNYTMGAQNSYENMSEGNQTVLWFYLEAAAKMRPLEYNMTALWACHGWCSHAWVNSCRLWSQQTSKRRSHTAEPTAQPTWDNNWSKTLQGKGARCFVSSEPFSACFIKVSSFSFKHKPESLGSSFVG